MADQWDHSILENPNWQDHISHFFAEGDRTCMVGRGIDLSSYYGVRLNADRIHFHTSRGSMPPPEERRRWSNFKVLNFYNWMAAGYPEDRASFAKFPLMRAAPPRVRRDIQEYESDPDALDKLRTAFEGMMAKGAADPTGYYRLAGIHWLPAPALYCRHHENAYNAWHRAYLIAFEDAMRTIDGCEGITLPYWDIQSGSIPDFLWDPPFDAFTFPVQVADLRGNVLAQPGDKTERRDKADLLSLLPMALDGNMTIDARISEALAGERWQDFNGWGGASRPHSAIIRAHDIGHYVCGTESVPNRSMATPNFAAFDPLFWLFHCNWDRLWWQWQLQRNATELAPFRELAVAADDPTDWIDDPTVAMLQPFDVLARDVINATEWGLDYKAPRSGAAPMSVPLSGVPRGRGSARAHSEPVVVSTQRLSIRVKGINRLVVPGAFTVVLMADDAEIASTYVFQSQFPEACPSCVKTGRFSVDFVVDATSVEGRRLSVKLRCAAIDGPMEISAEEAGDPTINARVLLQ